MTPFTNYTPKLNPKELSRSQSQKATERREYLIQHGTPEQQMNARGFIPGLGVDIRDRSSAIKKPSNLG